MHGYRKGTLRGISMSAEDWMREVEELKEGRLRLAVVPALYLVSTMNAGEI
jgi:hypothetical protein